MDKKAKAIFENGVNKCTPSKRKSLGIYENLFASDDIQALLGEMSSHHKSPEVAPSAPPLNTPSTERRTEPDVRSNSSISTAEANEAFFTGRQSHTTLDRGTSTEEEFTFTDSVLDEFAYNNK